MNEDSDEELQNKFDMMRLKLIDTHKLEEIQEVLEMLDNELKILQGKTA